MRFPTLLVAGILAGTGLGPPPAGALPPHREITRADDAEPDTAESGAAVSADDIAACEAYLDELPHARAQLRDGLRSELPDLAAAFAEHDELVARDSAAARDWLTRHRPRIAAAAQVAGLHGHEVDHLFLTSSTPGGIHELIEGESLSMEHALGGTDHRRPASALFRTHRDAVGQDLHRLAVEVEARFGDHHPGDPVRVAAPDGAGEPVHLAGEEPTPLPEPSTPPTASPSGGGEGRLTAVLLGVTGALAAALVLGF